MLKDFIIGLVLIAAVFFGLLVGGNWFAENHSLARHYDSSNGITCYTYALSGISCVQTFHDIGDVDDK